MARKAGLAGWLARLSENELIELLRARPDVALPPEPRGFDEVAHRLSTHYSVQAALDLLSTSGLQLLDAACAVGDGGTRRELLELLGGPEVVREDRVDAELASLHRLGLVWPDGDRLRLVGSISTVTPHPLGLGRPMAELLATLTVEQLSRIGQRYGLAKLPRKADWVARLSKAICDPGTVSRRLAAAEPVVRELVEAVAWQGPRVGGTKFPTSYERSSPDDLRTEPVLSGWVVPIEWGGVAEMPREVALAIRGAGWHPPLEPPPASPPALPADAHRLVASGRAAVAATMDGMSRLLALLGRAPLTMVKSGGVGARELRRAAKELRARENEVRLWVETAARAGLLGVDEHGDLLPTSGADDWQRAEPAAALATVLLSWWELAVTPTHRVDDAGKALPALGGRPVGPDAAALRAELLDTLAEPGPGAAVADLDAVIDLLAWRRPRAFGDAEELAPHAVATRAEAREFGLVADDALTPLGCALREAVRTDDPLAALTTAAAGAVRTPTASATFLPDLTAMVAGAPGVELATLLDGCADAESRDAASTWRFTPATVRRALDAGRTAEQLLAELAAVADRPLPQPLEYLVNDVARRHGQLRVSAVACCVCFDSPALATEVLRSRPLAALKLRSLSDTVLASAKPVTETLTALRAGGFAPVRQDSAGRTVVEKAPVRRAAAPPTPRRRPPSTRRPTSTDPVTLARRLRKGGEPRPEQLDPLGTHRTPNALELLLSPEHYDDPHVELAAIVGAAAPQLGPAEVDVLAHAVNHERPVLIGYVNADGRRTARVVEPLDLDPPLLTAWCRLREDERTFQLDRIHTVAPVTG